MAKDICALSMCLAKFVLRSSVLPTMVFVLGVNWNSIVDTRTSGSASFQRRGIPDATYVSI